MVVFGGAGHADGEVPPAAPHNNLHSWQPAPARSHPHQTAIRRAQTPPAPLVLPRRGHAPFSPLPCAVKRTARSAPLTQAVLFNDTWLYKADEGVWELCSVAGEPPPKRAAHSAVMHTTPRPQLIVFGGADMYTGSMFSDTWILSLSAPRWERVETSGPPPSPRGYHAAALSCGAMVVFGGRNSSKFRRPTAHVLDLATRRWSTIAPPTESDARAPEAAAEAAREVPPPGRSSHTAVAHGDLILFYVSTRARQRPQARHWHPRPSLALRARALLAPRSPCVLEPSSPLAHPACSGPHMGRAVRASCS